MEPFINIFMESLLYQQFIPRQLQQAMDLQKIAATIKKHIKQFVCLYVLQQFLCQKLDFLI